MKAALYARVSTKEQKEEGSSLESQIEACQCFAQEHCYEVPKALIFAEDWSGATLDRPVLGSVRSLIRAREVDALIAYSTDRLARNPIHIAIIAEECDKRGVSLIFVTEPLDNSPEGQLIQYVKGYAAQIEREKIADRTLRGKKMRARQGKIPAGCGVGLYGYDYIPGRGDGEGIRVVNEEQAKVVRMIFRWLIEDQMTLYGICVRLTEMVIPSPKGTPRWGLSTVARLVRNPAYCGKTYAFKYLSVEPKSPKKANKRYSKVARQLRSAEEWIKLPNATPVIISEETFRAAQEQLRRNFERAKRNQKNQYLLSGHIRCGLCGRRYNGHRNGNGRYSYLQYRCAGKQRTESLIPCASRAVRATEIEPIVWDEVQRALLNPELIIAEIHRRRQSNTDTTHLIGEIEMNRKRLQTLDEAETRALRLHLYAGMSEDKIMRELRRIRAERERIEAENAKLERRIQEARQAELDEASVRQFCERARANIEKLAFEEKRLALDALDIKAIIKPEGITIRGAIPAIASPSSR